MEHHLGSAWKVFFYKIIPQPRRALSQVPAISISSSCQRWLAYTLYKSWERKARLVAQLKAESGQTELQGTPAPESTDHTDQPTLTPTWAPAEVALPRRSVAEVVSATEPETTPRSTGSSLVSAAAGTEPSIVAGHAMLANQVPPLAAFSGEEKDGITFGDWHEQFELVAGLCGWSDHVKLVNVATRLKGVAYAFHRSCTATQRASYQQMVVMLTDRFTADGTLQYHPTIIIWYC